MTTNQAVDLEENRAITTKNDDNKWQSYLSRQELFAYEREKCQELYIILYNVLKNLIVRECKSE